MRTFDARDRRSRHTVEKAAFFGVWRCYRLRGNVFSLLRIESLSLLSR
jgi:hypothetical protein